MSGQNGRVVMVCHILSDHPPCCCVMPPRWLRLGAAVGVMGALHQYDTHFCHAKFNRNMRTFVALAETMVDYKIL